MTMQMHILIIFSSPFCRDCTGRVRPCPGCTPRCRASSTCRRSPSPLCLFPSCSSFVVVLVLHQLPDRHPDHHPRFGDVHLLRDDEGLPVDDPADVEVLVVVPSGFGGEYEALYNEGAFPVLPCPSVRAPCTCRGRRSWSCSSTGSTSGRGGFSLSYQSKIETAIPAIKPMIAPKRKSPRTAIQKLCSSLFITGCRLYGWT